MSRLNDFLKKYDAEVSSGNVIGFVNGKRELIGKLVDGNLIKLVEEDITEEVAVVEPARKPKKAKEVVEPAADSQLGIGDLDI